MLLAAVSYFALRRVLVVPEDRLLARAYNEQRRTELQLDGGEPVALFSPTLGPADGDDSVPLLQLRARAQQHLAKGSSTAYWEQIMGRIALLEGNGEEARRRLSMASARDPSLSGLKFDMASAQFEIGEAQSSPLEYAMAADLFGTVIEDPAAAKFKASAYFNRALCWQRIHNYPAALADFRSALDLEKDAKWQSEIRRRLPDLEDKVNRMQGKPASRLDTTPRGFLAAAQTQPRVADANFEIYLDHASREWLPERTPIARQALHRLAEMGRSHQDRWLSDVLAASDSPHSIEGFTVLARGLRAEDAGDADTALRNFLVAQHIFHSTGNGAAELRARVEMLYALQRLGHSDRCMQVAQSFFAGSRLKGYAWLYGYQILESAVCNASRGDSQNFLDAIHRALALAGNHSFPIQQMRAQGMLVDTLDAVGQHDEAWQAAAQGLQSCASAPACLPMRSYQFLLSLHFMMAGRELRLAAAQTARSAAEISDFVPNLQIRAYAHEVLGVAETAAGHPAEADRALVQATKVLNSMPAGDAVSLYRSDWETDRSSLLDAEGRRALALQRLQTSENQIARTDNLDMRQRYYAQLAQLLLESGRPAQAESSAVIAVADAEHALRETDSEAGKLAWERAYGRAYRLWVQARIATNRPLDSLQAWEWYRSAPYRQASSAASPSLLPVSFALPRDVDLAVVIARLEDAMFLWTITPQASVHVVRLAMPQQRLLQSAHTFAELCSDPDSSPQDIDFLGTQLYQAIFAPVDRQVQAAARIAIEADTSLQLVPFAALVQSRGRYFGEAHTLSMLPAWWTGRPVDATRISPSDIALVVEGTAALPAARSHPANSIPTEYFESGDVAAHFQRSVCLRGSQATIDQMVRNLPQAQVFHYNGHTFADSGRQGLLLQSGQLFTAASLRGISLRNCRLAVLATCSGSAAANPGNEDTSNLTQAFLQAGAQNVVAMLWDADARASRIAMIALYQALAHSAPVPDAVRIAQQRLRDDPATRHPFFWSSMQVFVQ
jgi:CHAT domain-containing protein/tetratricopeptide (TPR) repeat protein